MKTCLACVIVFLIGVVATLGFLLWRASGSGGSGRDGGEVVDFESARELVEELDERVREAGRDAGAAIEQRLTEEELEALFVVAASRHERGRQVLEISRSVDVDVEPDSLEVGLTLDLAAVEASDLPEDDRRAVERVLDMLPFLRGRDLYVAVAGTPEARDGEVALGGDPEMKVGFLSLPLDDMGERLGVSTDGIASELVFEVEGILVERVEAGRDELMVSGRPR